MKLAIIRTSKSPLNLQKYNIQEIGLAKALIKLGVSVHIYSSFAELSTRITYYTYNEAELELIPVKGIFWKQISYYPGLVNIVKEKSYDFVQVHEDSQLMTSFLISAASKKGAKTILYQGMYQNYKGVGGIYQKFLDVFLLKKTRKKADFVLAKTKSAKQYLQNKQFRNVKLLAVGLDIETDIANYTKKKDIFQFKQNFHHLLLYVGTLEPRRNIQFTLEVLNDIRNKNRSLKIGYIIVGQGPDHEKIRNIISRLGLTNNVMLIDSVPNNQIGDIYKACDLVLLPSQYEIYGMVVLEALYYGLPIISSKTAGPMDIIKQEFHGKVLNFDKKIWQHEIISYLNSEYMSGAFSLKRTEYVINDYSWNSIAVEYLATLGLSNEEVDFTSNSNPE